MYTFLFAILPSFLSFHLLDLDAFSQTIRPIMAVEAAVEFRTQHFPILLYHHVREYKNLTEKAAQDISVSPEEFEKQMSYLARAWYTSITSKDIEGNSVPCKSIMITLDDGYDNVYTDAFPILKNMWFTAVIALIVARMDEHGYLSGEQIRTLQHAGWEIASHTWDHSFLTQIQKTQLAFQIKDSKKYLEQWFGKKIGIFVYPGWFYGPESLKIVENSWYSYAFNTHFWEANLVDHPLELKRIEILPDTTVEKLAEMLERAKQSQ